MALTVESGKVTRPVGILRIDGSLSAILDIVRPVAVKDVAPIFHTVLDQLACVERVPGIGCTNKKAGAQAPAFCGQLGQMLTVSVKR